MSTIFFGGGRNTSATDHARLGNQVCSCDGQLICMSRILLMLPGGMSSGITMLEAVQFFL